MPERVLVVGAGIAGLCVALALAPTGRLVTLLDRDPPPPPDPDLAFVEWKRQGVAQLRHSHAFVARLRNILRDHHPGLLSELLAAGANEIPFEALLTDVHRRTYAPRPEDADLVALACRRTTLEVVMRRYVERLPGVEIRVGADVAQFLVERPDLGPPVVAGVSLAGADGQRHVLGDIVIDAGGRASQAFEQLREIGAGGAEEHEPAGVLYFTRHYRLLDGAAPPPRGRAPTTGDLGYLKFGLFPADHGYFSITLCLSELDHDLRRAVTDPQTFDAICRRMPGLAPWVDDRIAVGLGRVRGMGGLQSLWRDHVRGEQSDALGFFAVGDALIQTNPLYGRGCAFAAVQAYLLRDALDASDDPAERAITYARAVRHRLRPFYVAMRAQDRAAMRRARRKMSGSASRGLLGSVTRSLVEHGVGVAVRSDPEVLRDALRAFHMLDPPDAWLRRPANIASILGAWARGPARNADAYPDRPGPTRTELIRALGAGPSQGGEIEGAAPT